MRKPRSVGVPTFSGVSPYVRVGGVEPPRAYTHCHLKTARLPFRHARRQSTNLHLSFRYRNYGVSQWLWCPIHPNRTLWDIRVMHVGPFLPNRTLVGSWGRTWAPFSSESDIRRAEKKPRMSFSPESDNREGGSVRCMTDSGESDAQGRGEGHEKVPTGFAGTLSWLSCSCSRDA